MSAEQKQKQMALQAALQIASASASIKPLDPENVIKAAEKILAWMQEDKESGVDTQAIELKEKMISQQWDACIFAEYAAKINKINPKEPKDSETPDPAADDCFKCSFCGTPKHDALYLFASTTKESLCICNSCIFVALNLFSEEAIKQTDGINNVLKARNALKSYQPNELKLDLNSPFNSGSAIKAKHGQSIQDTLNTVSKWNVGPYQK